MSRGTNERCHLKGLRPLLLKRSANGEMVMGGKSFADKRVHGKMFELPPQCHHLPCIVTRDGFYRKEKRKIHFRILIAERPFHSLLCWFLRFSLQPRVLNEDLAFLILGISRR